MPDHDLISDLFTLSEEKHQRLLIHIEGQHQFCVEKALALVHQLKQQDDLPRYCLTEEAIFQALSPRQTDNIQLLSIDTPINKIRHLLGTQSASIIIDAHVDFSLNILGILSGTIHAGAALILLTPDLTAWHKASSGYLSYAAKVLSQNKQRLHFIQGIEHCQNAAAIASFLSALPNKNDYLQQGLLLQRHVIDAIVKVQQGRNKRPLIIEADRGRGKSAALGIAAAELLLDQRRVVHIAVTAPQISSLKSLFKHLIEAINVQNESSLCWQSVVKEQRFSIGNNTLFFSPPDQLLGQQQAISLVLIDEAAAIPVALLKQLSQRYSRLVFSSTVYGYEGNGRGFSVRFYPYLQQTMPQNKRCFLQHAMRWSDGDAVEGLMNELLLLDAERHKIPALGLNDAPLVYQSLSQAQLIEQPQQLKALFSLLVLAHYQTSGDDLRILLDHPAIHIRAVFQQSQLQAVALIMLEGRFSEQEKSLLTKAARRLRGHLLPQQCLQEGFPEALDFAYARIMRIAVQPEYQGHGIGSFLIEQIKQEMSTTHIDFMGASFSAEHDVLSFWQQQGFCATKLGTKADSATGLPSISVLTALSSDEISTGFLSALREQWQDNLFSRLQQYQGLRDDLLIRLFKDCRFPCNERDQQQLLSYIKGLRGFEVVKPALVRQLAFFLSHQNDVIWPQALEPIKLPLIENLFLNENWQAISDYYDVSGRKNLEVGFRQALLFLHETNR